MVRNMISYTINNNTNCICFSWIVYIKYTVCWNQIMLYPKFTLLLVLSPTNKGGAFLNQTIRIIYK
jgi:hypothetical protein